VDGHQRGLGVLDVHRDHAVRVEQLGDGVFVRAARGAAAALHAVRAVAQLRPHLVGHGRGLLAHLAGGHVGAPPLGRRARKALRREVHPGMHPQPAHRLLRLTLNGSLTR